MDYDPNSYSIGSSGSVTYPQSESARMQQVKQMDERLQKLTALIDNLTSKLQPALRSPEPSELAKDISEAPNESDVVAHLRHTNRRLASLAETVSDLTNRVDL